MAIQMSDFDDDRRIDLRDLRRKRHAEGMIRSEAEILGAGTFQMLQLSTLQIDQRYQGHIVRAHINKLKREFDPRLVGVFMISRRNDGSDLILDGQHREVAIRELGHAEINIGCIVLEGLSYEEEAYLYHKFNENRRRKTPQERLKSAIEAREQWALAIHDAVNQAGFRLNFDDGSLANGRITGADVLIRVQANYRRDHLAETLMILADVWGTRIGPRSSVIGGMADFTSVYRGVFKRSRLISCPLRTADPDVLLKIASERNRINKVTTIEGFSTVIVDHYNDHLRKDILPSRGEQVAINKASKHAERQRGK